MPIRQRKVRNLTAAMVAAISLSVTAAKPEVLEKVVVDKIWPGVPVRYCLLTHGDTQYVAYYNVDRRTVVAQRKLGEPSFTKMVLPSESDKPPRHSRKTSTIQGWDAHNYLTLAVDKAGHIHLSGNMHGDPLLYLRSDTPGDITSLKQVKSMVGRAENRVTYPKFMKGLDGDLLFKYRHGGNGLLILDEETLELLGTEPKPQKYPESLTTVTSDFPGMQVNWFGDIGSSPNQQGRYVLRWETLGRKRDRPRRGKLPASSDLVVFKIGKAGQ